MLGLDTFNPTAKDFNSTSLKALASIVATHRATRWQSNREQEVYRAQDHVTRIIGCIATKPEKRCLLKKDLQLQLLTSLIMLLTSAVVLIHTSSQLLESIKLFQLMLHMLSLKNKQCQTWYLWSECKSLRSIGTMRSDCERSTRDSSKRGAKPRCSSSQRQKSLSYASMSFSP